MSPRWGDIEEGEEDFAFYGTPVECEEEGGGYRKTVKDVATTRALPVWKQDATDEEGRKRFHGEEGAGPTTFPPFCAWRQLLNN